MGNTQTEHRDHAHEYTTQDFVKDLMHVELKVEEKEWSFERFSELLNTQ